MKVLITGNLGYIGPVVQQVFLQKIPSVQLRGFDSGFFAHCLTTNERSPDWLLSEQFYGDVRNPPANLFDGVDAVIHLAAISNDPMGVTFEQVTDAINHRASIDIARAAKLAGVGHFVFASSCSMYGFAEGGARTEKDELNPLTAYARSKVATEKGLAGLADGQFLVTCLRFATACGMSDRLRLDLVLNDFVAGAIASGRIDILSNGTPWRPLIPVEDMAIAMHWAANREANRSGYFLAVNTGSDDWNFQVKDLAEAVAAVIPGTEVAVNESAQADKRSYRVSFDLFNELAPDIKPVKSLAAVIGDLRDGLQAIDFSDGDFRQGIFMRLKTLDRHREHGRLDEELRWC